MMKGLAVALLAVVPGVLGAEDYPEALDWRGVSTQGWDSCAQPCLLETIKAARSAVIFHSKGELQRDEAKALVAAIRRGIRVEVYVGKANALSDEVIWFADDIYAKWAATADDQDTSMLGMGGCVMGRTSAPTFLVTDPFTNGAGGSPALVYDAKKTDEIDVVVAASVVAETEDFIECKLQKN